MRRYLYLSTAVAGVMMTAGAGVSFAQCVTTQNCAELGYTCPFGDTFACTGGSSEITPEQCTQLGFTHTCTGTNETGGGELCNNKYAFCSCADGYEWSNGSCQPSYFGCTIGALFYSDNTCSNNLESGKTLLGVVIMEKTTSANGWIMTISSIQIGIAWSTENVDIPGLTNITSKSNLTDIQASCTNTDIITKYGNSSTYPAAWAAKNYSPSGTPSGKSWCLPSGGLLNSALNNSTNLAKIDAGITISGGKKIGSGANYGYEYIWTSSEDNNSTAWSLDAYSGGTGSISMYELNKSFGPTFPVVVRPVLAF